MGQMTIGVLYGCEVPKELEDDKAVYDITTRFRVSAKIDTTTRGPRIRSENEGNKRLLGVWVAVGGSGEDGTAYLGDRCLPLDQFAVEYAYSIDIAKKMWKRFERFCKTKENIDLPVATLWLTPCEVA